MQYIAIKTVEHDGKNYYSISAIPLKNKNKTIIQKIPHPIGTDSIEFEDIEHAKEAVIRAGFSYILPDGKKGSNIPQKKEVTPQKTDYETKIYEIIKENINCVNSNVTAAAVQAIAEFPTEETFDILFEKLGEENELIRKNAISGICSYGNLLHKEIINALKSENWITRNSAITCIQNLNIQNNSDIEDFLCPLIETCKDSNPIVQANAITTIANVYKEYRKLINK